MFSLPKSKQKVISCVEELVPFIGAPSLLYCPKSYPTTLPELFKAISVGLEAAVCPYNKSKPSVDGNPLKAFPQFVFPLK